MRGLDGFDLFMLMTVCLVGILVEAIILARVYRAGREEGEEIGALRERLRRSEVDLRIEKRLDALLREEGSFDWPEELRD